MQFRRAAATATHTRAVSPRTLPYLLATLGLLLTLISNSTLAQNDAPTLAHDEVVRVSTDLVTVPVFVTDREGRRVSGLTRDDFTLLDDGRAVETDYFAAGADRVALLFLLDASGSTRETVGRMRETALAIFEQFGDRSRLAVMQFEERATLNLPFTTDARAARSAFNFPPRRDSRTAIFDAALAAVRTFSAHNSPPVERRIVILISDGLDTVSSTRAKAVVNEARSNDVSFYVVHLPLYWAPAGQLVPRRPSNGFRDLAEKTGGRFFVVGDNSDVDPSIGDDRLRPIFNAIAEDIRGQYLIGFYSNGERARPGEHRIEVRLKTGERRRLRLRQLRERYTLANPAGT